MFTIFVKFVSHETRCPIRSKQLVFLYIPSQAYKTRFQSHEQTHSQLLQTMLQKWCNK